MSKLVSDLEDFAERIGAAWDEFLDAGLWSAREIIEDEDLELADDEVESFAWNHPDWWTHGLLNETGREHVVLLSPTDIRFTDSGVEAVVAQFAE